jgi:hypothetical protein
MGVYRFVGSYCEIDNGRIKMDRFGQRVEFSGDVADTVIRGGGAILPEEDFENLGFTADEQAAYAYPGQQESAPESFKTKRNEAHLAYCRLRAERGE